MVVSDLDSTDTALIDNSRKALKVYLSSDTLKVTDFYSCLMKNVHNTKLLNAVDITERCFKLDSYKYSTEIEYSLELAQLFSILSEGNQVEDWEIMLLLCNQKKHIIQCVVDGCANLLNQRGYEKVALILSRTWLKFLTPLVVLLTWAQCSNFAETVMVLKNLLALGTEINYLTPACKKLLYQSKLIEWCMYKVGEFLSPDKNNESMLNALFIRLKSSSILYALNDTKLISLLKIDEVTDLLEKQPILTDNILQRHRISNERDIFYCYSILRQLINLIVCSVSGTLIEYKGEKVPVSNQLITAHISDIGVNMKKILLPSFRVELLENIFSLLFLQRSDFKHQPGEDIDSDNVSFDSNMSRNMSHSFDSLIEDHMDHMNYSLSMAKNTLYNSAPCFGNKDFSESLLHEIEESSTDTVKSNDIDSHFPSADMPSGFVTTTCILKQVLSFISDNLLLMSSSRGKNHIHGDSNTTDTIYSPKVEHHITRITSYTSEAQWRLELVSGLHSDYVTRASMIGIGNLLNTFESNVMIQMLGSSEALVYLTMKKQDLVQAKQVIKMYNLGGQPCCEEVDFMEQLSINLEKLKAISVCSKARESQRTDSPLDMIRSNASAGKISSEVTQIAESLLQHSIVMKGLNDFSTIETSICIDLIFSVPLSFSICKSLLDLASLKAEYCNHDEFVLNFISTKLKVIKMFLQFMNNKKYLKIFEWRGQIIPSDFLTLYVSLPSKVSPEMEGLNNNIFHQGKVAFDELKETIDKLNENYKNLVEDNIDVGDNDLMQNATRLFTLFTSETIANMNNVSSIFDYLKSLFKYVNKLARWQLNHKMNEISHLPKTMKVANPFLVFNEDISDTFGRLLFDWEMPPTKLEGFAHQANIKLIKIVAEKCGVFVGSNKKHRRKGEWSMLFQQHSLLNECEESLDVIELGKSPNETVEMLLNDVLDIRNKTSQLNAGEVLNTSTIELSKVDLNELKTHTQKLSFFINLFNLLLLHAFMLSTDEKFSSHFHIYIDELLHLLQSSFGRLIFHNHLAYKVGKLGVVTALDLYRNVIKCESASSFFGIHKDAYRSTIPSLKNYATDNVACYSFFAVLHEIVDFPFVQVVYPDTIKSVLESSTLNYLEEDIKVNDSNLEVWISKFIFVHTKCFLEHLKERGRMLGAISTDDDDDDKDVGGDENSNICHCGGGNDGKIDVVDNGYKHNNFMDVDDARNAANSVGDGNGYNDDDDHGDSDDNCAGAGNKDDDYSEIRSLLICLSNSASPDFNRKLRFALEKCYSVKVGKRNWCLSNNSIHPDSNLIRNPVIQRTQAFSLMSEVISNYLKEACLLAGTLIELCLVKNQLIKHLTTIFNNNVLYNSVDEKDKKLSVFTSLQGGLAKFKTFTRYYSLKHLVDESSIIFETVMKSTEHFEFSLPSSLMNKFYSSVQNLLHHKFICTLSPDQWSEIIPVLLECCFHTQHFWKIVLSNLELFLPTCGGLFEIVLCHCISEIKDLGILHNIKESFYLKYTLKRLIMLLKDMENKGRSTLQCKQLLPIQDVIDLLKICLEDETCKASTRNLLCTCLKECEWYQQVFNLHLSVGNHIFPSWQAVKHFVEEEPEKISPFLISTGNCHLIDMWCEKFNLPENVYEHCFQWKLKSILNNEQVDYLVLQLTLDKIECSAMCLRICQYLLAENNGYNSRNIFIIQYMTNTLSEQLDPVERGKLILNKIGILLIEMIPIDIRDLYQHLQNNPLLIVEQLLMNMKVKLVGNALRCIHLETLEEGNVVSTLESGCDELVARYAQLALDLSGLKQDHYMVGSVDLSDTENDIKECKRRAESQLSIKKENEVHSPLQPVDPKKWVKDNDVVSCMLCRDLFNMFNRRHHCRHCGRVTCATCSPFYCYMARYKRKERTCKICYINNYQKHHKHLSEDKGRDLHNTVLDISHDDIYVFDTPSPHVLSCDSNTNKETRASFSYEKAPSASLCLAIVDLCTNHCAAAGLLVKFSKVISQYLHGSHEGIDLNMVAGMIELILYHAKLKFLKAGDFEGIELTETYRSQIEMVKILLESTWHQIPTMHELTQPESLRRLRDQLIENEQFNLAIEVTSALDTTINFLMGLSRLKYGDMEKAREYFARCLTQGETVNTFGPNKHYLERIVEEIENSPLIALNHVTKVEDALLLASIMQVHKNSTSECILDTRRYEEIVFYLKTYGSHSHLINFFVKNRLFKKAVSFIRKKKCSPDQFVIYLVIPTFQEGCFDLLCNELKTNDSNHRFWESYLNHTCKYLSKQGMYHCLYELQLAIKDYFRAALTCVRFYLGSVGEPPSTYAQLSLRLRYLLLASSHLENLLKERNSRSSFVSHVGYTLLGEDKVAMNEEIPTSDIMHHLYTIKLQMEVTTFLDTEKPHIDLPKLVTLFGNGKERAELVIHILMLCREDSIPLASKIIREFQLPSLPTVGRAVKRMVHLGKYDVVSSMIQQIELSGLVSPNDKDEILLQVIKVMIIANQGKDANQFIKFMKSDIFKVNALIACGQLREAYLEAVKNKRFEEIEKILDEAKRTNQRNMVDICEKWLRNYKEIHKRGMID